MKAMPSRRGDRPPFSLLMAGAGPRALGALVLIGLLWLAVAWALGGVA